MKRRLVPELTDLWWFKQIPPEQAQTGEVRLRHHQPSPHEVISYRNKTGQMKTWEGNRSWGNGSWCLKQLEFRGESEKKQLLFIKNSFQFHGQAGEVISAQSDFREMPPR